MAACETYVDLLKRIEKGYLNPKALNQCDSEGVWQATSTEEVLRAVKDLALGLHELGLKRGDRVGIFATSSPEWTIADLAIVMAGGVMVPLFTTISEENFLYEVQQTKLKIIFVEGVEQWPVFQKYVECFDVAIALGGNVPAYDKVKSLKVVMDGGNALDKKYPTFYAELQAALKPEDIITIIYTSGSTGVPKGVELTQLNLIGQADFQGFSWDPKTDCYLSVLPLEHVFGHCFNLWMLYRGVSIYYTNDHKRLSIICSEVKPTMIAVVPRLLEKVYGKMVEKLHHAGLFKRLIGRWAFQLASKPESKVRKFFLPLLDALVYGKLRAALGGKMRMFISGGAPLSPQLQHFFEVIGIPIYQGWGLTEACPLSTNFPAQSKIGTVGRLLPDQQVIISPEGELLVKGTLVMHGYYENPEQTARALDAQGYLHTGDKGTMDSEGYLTIVGRLKELYKTSTGEYIAPMPIEQSICRHSLIDMALVVAEGRKFASCLLFPNMDVVLRLKKKQRQENLSDKDFLKSAYIRYEIDTLLAEVNRHLNHPEQIRDYRFVLEPLTIKGGDLTPSMKIRREAVTRKYNKLIDEMYQNEVEE